MQTKLSDHMELFKTNDFYIFHQGEHSLWCSRKTGLLEPKSGKKFDLMAANITFFFIKPTISFFFSMGANSCK